MKKRSVSFAMICAKHGWDPALKSHALTKAAVYYLFAGVLALCGELVWGWFFRTPTGSSIVRFCSRSCHRASRIIFGKGGSSNNSPYNAVKHSDNSDDDDEDESGIGGRRRRGGGGNRQSRTGGGADSGSGTSESDFEMMNSAGTERRKLPTHLRRSKNSNSNDNNKNDGNSGETMVYGGIARLPTRDVDAVPSAIATNNNNGW